MHEHPEDWFDSWPDWCPAYYPTDENGCTISYIPINDEYVEHDAVVYQLNQRYGIINHLDHSGTTSLGLCVETHTTNGLTPSDFHNLSATDKYSVFLTGGCHVCPIERDYYIGEQWINAPNGGVTFLGASIPISTDAGNQYNYEFFNSLYNSDLHAIGLVNNLTSINCNNTLCLNLLMQLLGDPELSIYTDAPITMNVTHNDTVTNGNSDFSVDVTDFPTGEKVTICLYKENEVDTSSITNTGSVIFNITPDTPGEMYLTVTCHNAEPYEPDPAIIVTQNPGVHLYKTVVNVIDENGNGFIEPGETIDLSIELCNAGAVNASDITGVLSTSDPNTVISVYTSKYPDISSGETGSSIDNYTFATTTEETFHGKAIPFELDITTAQGDFSESFFLNLKTAQPEPGNRTVLVNGEETNTFNAGDAVQLYVDLHNYGTVTASNITAVISTNLPLNIVAVDVGTQNYGDIESFAKVTNTEAFTFDVG